MADPAKHVPVVHGGTLISDLKRLFSVLRARGTVTFCSGFTFAFVVFTVFFTFSPNASNIFRTIPTPTTAVGSSSASPRSQFSSVFSYFFPNNPPSVQIYSLLSPPPPPPPLPPLPPPPLQPNSTRSTDTTISTPEVSKEIPNSENQTPTAEKPENSIQNQTLVAPTNNASSPSGRKNQTQISENNQTAIAAPESPKPEPSSLAANKTASVPKPEPVSSEKKNTMKSGEVDEKSVVPNKTASLEKKQKQKQSNGSKSGVSVKQGRVDSAESLRKCHLYDGSWVKDESYKPYYKPGSCSIIDEQFNCILNGRPDKDYQKFRWKPKGCDFPRLDGKRMLEMIRGKRLVFVGDSLNRNMWESLVCILRNSVKDPKKVFEAHGRHHFRGEAEYSFIFKDYDSSVEFFVSPFLVQEWETTDKNGTKKETLRLDLIGKTAQHYKTADIIIFNTGHWWTHEKTSKGEDYYQEGSHVYKELNVLEAFDKALTTWARWVDGNVPSNSTVLYRGYSDSHFSGGQWNSGGACDSETVPINDEKYLRPYPPKMAILEKVLRGMKTPVTYLNVTRLTDFRKDGHPSIYRKQNLSEEERRSPLLYQDCSHWCLPGVPDAWNELLYAELLVKLGQKHQQQQQQKKT